MELENSIPGLKELQTNRARMVSDETKRLVVIFYHLDGRSEPYTFIRLETVHMLSDHPDSVWIKGEAEIFGLVSQAVNSIKSISAELVPVQTNRRKA